MAPASDPATRPRARGADGDGRVEWRGPRHLRQPTSPAPATSPAGPRPRRRAFRPRSLVTAGLAVVAVVAVLARVPLDPGRWSQISLESRLLRRPEQRRHPQSDHRCPDLRLRRRIQTRPDGASRGDALDRGAGRRLDRASRPACSPRNATGPARVCARRHRGRCGRPRLGLRQKTRRHLDRPRRRRHRSLRTTGLEYRAHRSPAARGRRRGCRWGLPLGDLRSTRTHRRIRLPDRDPQSSFGVHDPPRPADDSIAYGYRAAWIRCLRPRALNCLVTESQARVKEGRVPRAGDRRRRGPAPFAVGDGSSW